jgi:hypothetical protein
MTYIYTACSVLLRCNHKCIRDAVSKLLKEGTQPLYAASSILVLPMRRTTSVSLEECPLPMCQVASK